MNLKKNAPEYSVSGITDAIRNIIYENFAAVKIRGEISGLKISTKGHVYFSLKDANSSINAVCFASHFKKIKINLTDGVEILAYGEIDTFGSGYQLKVESVEYAGIGALMKLMEERKQKLLKMGLFDARHKKPIPQSFEIENLGVITSGTGAVIQDIINRINERYPKNILLFNSVVQGTEAPEQIISGIKYFNNESGIKPDVIIIARGGGSVEDLFCFNDEQIALAVFESDIPIISAIGHETDTTIIDFVSDLRAATPTAAAEIVTTPTIHDLHNIIVSNYRIFLDLGNRKIAHCIENHIFLKKRLFQTKNNIALSTRNFDILKQRLKSSIEKKIFIIEKNNNINLQNLFKAKNKMYQKLDFYAKKIKIYDKSISLFAQNILNKINNLKNRMQVAVWRKYDTFISVNIAKKLLFYNIKMNYIKNIDNKFNNLKQSISYLDFAKNLRKGYAIILDKNNKITKNKQDLEDLNFVKVKLHDGFVEINKN